MARMPRIVVPGVPLQVTQWGSDRQAIFFDPQDYLTFLLDLGEAGASFGCAIHAYALMTHHVRLLLTPEEPDGPSRLMQALGRRQVRYLKRRCKRTGTLCEGLSRSAALDPDRYLLACSRHIEMSPVRAGIVSEPAAYPWSSFRCNGLGARDAIVTPHPVYTSLGSSHPARQLAYRGMFERGLDGGPIDSIRWGTRSGAAIGGDRVAHDLGSLLARPADRRAHGGDRRSLDAPRSRLSRGQST